MEGRREHIWITVWWWRRWVDSRQPLLSVMEPTPTSVWTNLFGMETRLKEKNISQRFEEIFLSHKIPYIFSNVQLNISYPMVYHYVMGFKVTSIVYVLKLFISISFLVDLWRKGWSSGHERAQCGFRCGLYEIKGRETRWLHIESEMKCHKCIKVYQKN